MYIRSPVSYTHVDVYKRQEQPKARVEPLGKFPDGQGFWGVDPYGNAFQITEDSSWFGQTKHPVGGVAGAVSYTHLDVYKRQGLVWLFLPTTRRRTLVG